MDSDHSALKNPKVAEALELLKQARDLLHEQPIANLQKSETLVEATIRRLKDKKD